MEWRGMRGLQLSEQGDTAGRNGPDARGHSNEIHFRFREGAASARLTPDGVEKNAPKIRDERALAPRLESIDRPQRAHQNDLDERPATPHKCTGIARGLMLNRGRGSMDR
jgi:hypothetical protein